MGAFLYGVSLQWKSDMRSKTLLITCYIVPILFFAIMGGIFTSVMPEARYTLIQSMTVFGVTMGALIGLPPSLILYIAAPRVFNAEIPENPGTYFISLAIFIAVSLSIASIIGLAVKDQAKTSMVSILVFLPSIMLSGIMFPIELLPKAFETIGKLFPATWGYKRMTENVFKFESLLPLLLIFVLAAVMCGILLRRIDT